MKKLLLLTLITFTSSGSLTPVPINIEPIVENIEIDNTQEELYVKANNWMVESFNSAKSVIQFSDKESGTVTGKYLLRTIRSSKGAAYPPFDIYALIKIQVKDGATRITITPDQWNYIAPVMGVTEHSFSEEQARLQIATLIESYKEFLKTDDSF